MPLPILKARANVAQAAGQCLCGAVRFEIDYPARWAWHDHSRASRLAHGAVYATYVASWRKRFRITAGDRAIARYADKMAGGTRSFCPVARRSAGSARLPSTRICPVRAQRETVANPPCGKWRLNQRSSGMPSSSGCTVNWRTRSS